MTTSTTSRNSKRKIRLWAVLAWLLIWQLASMWIGQEILLVSPVTVVVTLIRLAGGAQFWLSVASSMLRIIGGFLLAVVLGVALAGLSAASGRLREFLLPFVATVKSIPVASFVILVLIWVSSRNLSVLISFLMVFPVIYTNVLDRHQPDGPGAPGDGGGLRDPLWPEAPDDLCLPGPAVFSDRLFPGPRALLEGGRGRGSDRDPAETPSGRTCTMPRSIWTPRPCSPGLS